MGIFDLFSGKPGQYVSEENFEDNLERQLQMTPMTLKQLRRHGVSADDRFKLEFFFYTNAEEKAEALANRLAQAGYKVEYGESDHDRKKQVVTGWTRPILMSNDSVLKWTRQMCEVGYAHDCEFDGWGTSSQQ